MKYEITIRELTEYTQDEIDKNERLNRMGFGSTSTYSDKPYHESRVLHAEVSRDEFEAVKKAIIGVM